MTKQPITMAPLELTEAQQGRIVAAIAAHDARVAAYRAGVSLADAQALRWVVEVDGFEFRM